MKLLALIAASTTFSTLTAAIPLERRNVLVVTKTNVVYTTVDVVKTIWVNGPSSAPTSAPKLAPSAPAPAPHSKAPKPSIQAAPTTAPSAKPSPAPAPSSKPAAPQPKKPKPHKKPAPAPAPSSSPSPSPTPTPGGSGQTFSGDGTYYAVGLGSCGWTSTENENIVALSIQTMNNGVNPNTNPMCGRMISISYGGTTQTAKVVDSCQACAPEDIDMSIGLFTQFAPLGVGRLHGVKWSYIS